MSEGYLHDYPTCARTYATLRIYHDDLDPAAVSRDLELHPSATQQKCDELWDVQDRPANSSGGWFLSSEEKVQSRDSRHHIDWLLDQIEPKRDVLKLLQDAGSKIDILCYWLSARGNGGPMLSRGTMGRLANLNLTLWFDAYVVGGDDNYTARTFQNVTEYAEEQRRIAEAGDNKASAVPSRSICVIIRVDLADDARVPLDAKVDVAEVYWTPEEAFAAARRLNEEHAGKGRRYFCRFAKLIGEPRDV